MTARRGHHSEDNLQQQNIKSLNCNNQPAVIAAAKPSCNNQKNISTVWVAAA